MTDPIHAWSTCPQWGARGHNFRRGVHRSWPRFWRFHRECLSCGVRESAAIPMPPTTDQWFALVDSGRVRYVDDRAEWIA